MAKLKIYNQITDEDSKVILSDWFGVDSICYKDITEFLESMDENDNDIEILLHCPGGSCIEGWAIYDKLRTSGKNITATIEGMCASMATIILLAAPKERRFGFQNASLLIHDPAVCGLDDWTCERLTADEISRLKSKLSAQEAALIEERNKILNMYVDRTGADRDELASLMKEEKFVDMDKAIELGFICGTVQPNTASVLINKNNKKMAKEGNVTIGSKILNYLLSLGNFASVDDVKVPTDQKITAVDGSVITVEREDGDPQVGDKATPNGCYTLEDGTIITIEGEVIKSIEKETEDKAKIAQLTTDLETANNEIKALKDASVAAQTAKEDLEKQITDLTTAKQTLEAEKEAVISDKAKSDSEIEALKTTNADLNAKLEGLTSEIEALKADKATLEAAQKTDEEKAILDTVAKAGGKEWFDSVCNLQSNFIPNSPQFSAHGDAKTDGVSKTKQMIAELKAKQDAKRKKTK